VDYFRIADIRPEPPAEMPLHADGRMGKWEALRDEATGLNVYFKEPKKPKWKL
jgi:hypothetical protein